MSDETSVTEMRYKVDEKKGKERQRTNENSENTNSAFLCQMVYRKEFGFLYTYVYHFLFSKTSKYSS